MRRVTIVLLLAVTAFIGCEAKNAAEPVVQKAHVAGKPDSDDPAVEQVAEADPSIGSQLTTVMNQIGEKSEAAASDVSEMTSNLIDDVSTTSSEAAQHTADWVTSLYEQARNTGETTTTTAKDWVMEDIRRGGSWEYRVDVVTEDAKQQQEILNDLGKRRWECYEITVVGDETRFYSKRPSSSVIRSLPVRDVLRLLPLLSGGGE